MTMTTHPGGFAIWAEESPAIEPAGSMMALTISGQRYVMTRHHLLAMLERGNRAVAKQDANRAKVIPIKQPARAARKAHA